MKRAASVELEKEAKRRRIDPEEEKPAEDACMVEDMDATDTADIPLVGQPVGADEMMKIINESSTSVHNLPLEVLGNHIFKFFDFEYWLKSFVTVCKVWQQAAVQSTLDKQLRVRKMVAASVIRRYRVSTLIIKFTLHLHELAMLINASSRVISVNISSFVNDVGWDTEFSAATVSKFSFNKVSTLFLHPHQLRLLSLFPKASKVSIFGREFPDQYTAPSVLELALQANSRSGIKVAMQGVKTTFPSVQTIYLLVDEQLITNSTEEGVKEELYAMSKEFGISIVYKYIGPGPVMSDLAYHEYFNFVGRTPFCNMMNSDTYHTRVMEKLSLIFEQYPALTLEYEQDLSTRKRQFLFPYTEVNPRSLRGHKYQKLNWNTTLDILQLCYEKNMLPPKGLVAYHLQQRDYKAAVETFKSHQLADGRMLIEKVPSLVQLSNYLGSEPFKRIIDRGSFYRKIGFKATDYEDLTPIRDLLAIDIVKFAHRQLLSRIHEQEFGETLWQFLVQLDSWLHPSSSRRISDKLNVGIQYLSDEAQAKHFFSLLWDGNFERLASDSKFAAKPLNQMVHKGAMLLSHSRNILSELPTDFNFDVNLPDKNGYTPLIHAIVTDVEWVLELLQLGADPNFAGNTLLPLHFSVFLNKPSLEVITALLVYGADINRRDYDTTGRSVWPISLAMAQDVKVVELLLNFGADPTVVDEAGNTLLHMLFKSGFCEKTDTIIGVMKLLVPYIDINKRNNLGDSILHCAIGLGYNTSILETIIKCGADVNLPDALGRTPLMIACSVNGLSTLNVLLATNQMDVKARTKSGESFVYFVMTLMKGRMVKLMQNEEFKKFCEPYLTDDNIQFVKDECKNKMANFNLQQIITSHVIFAKLFVELGYEVKESSFSLLNHLIVTDPEKSEVFDYLLANGLDINAKNKVGETALFKELKKLPLNKKRAKKIRFLINHGASVTLKNNHGVAPIDIDPLIETRYSNGLHVDYLLASSNKKMPSVNLMELRQKKSAAKN